jgi:putative membrane protein
MNVSYPKPTIDPKYQKRLNIATWIVSAIVLIVVASMRNIKFETSLDFSWLPAFYSVINGLTAVCLVYGLILIRKRKYSQHQKIMFFAMILSAIFIVSYVVYHTTTEETKFCKEGTIRFIYFALLISHVILAGIIFPFILFTFVRAVTGQYERHRKLAKFVFPFWLYVAVSGPILYVLLWPCFK